MNRGSYPLKHAVLNMVAFFAAFLGGGAATNGTIPTSGILTDDAAGLFPKGANLGTSLTYVSTGIYTAVYSETFKNVLWATGIVVSDGASPTTALYALVSKITPGTNTLTVRVYAPGGTLTDLGTSDLLILRIEAADTGALA